MYATPPKLSATPSPRPRNEGLCGSDHTRTNDQVCNTQLVGHEALQSQPPPVRKASAFMTDPGAMHDGLYSHDAGQDDTVDNRLQIGKLKITERIGGLFRPEAGKRVSAVISWPSSSSFFG